MNHSFPNVGVFCCNSEAEEKRGSVAAWRRDAFQYTLSDANRAAIRDGGRAIS